MGISLRPYEIEDAQLLYRELGQDFEMFRYTGWNPYADLESARAFVAQCVEDHGKGSYSWLVLDREDPVGIVGVYDIDRSCGSAELGYSTFRKHWGRGFATQAAKAAIDFIAQDEAISRLSAWAAVENAASVKVLQACGMHLVDIQAGGLDVDGLAYDKALYEIEF